MFTFACGVVSQCPQSIPHLASREIWRQLVKAAPSASNNLEEADEASSDADFIAKMKIALREAKESRRCLRFLRECKLTGFENLNGLEDEARQIASIFAAIIIKVKRRIGADQVAKVRNRH